MKKILDLCYKNKIPFLIGVSIYFTFAPLYILPFGYLVISYFIHFNFYEPDLRKKIIKGFFFGLGFYIANYYWMSFSMLVDFKSYWLFFFLSIFAIPIYFLAFYLIPQILILDLFLKKISNKKWQFYLFASFIWFLFEIIRSSILFLIDFQGFPWGLSGYGFFITKYLSQIYAFIGIYGATFIIIFLFSSLFLILDKNFKFIKRVNVIIFLLPSILVFTIISLIGFNYYHSDKGKLIKEISYKIIHTSIAKHHNFQYENMVSNIKNAIKLSNQTENQHSDLLIWPESGISFPLREGQKSEMIKSILAEMKNFDYFITGLPLEEDNKYYNSFSIYDRKSNLIDKYKKKYLVPFGEYVPYFRIFDKAIANQTSGYYPGELKQLNIADDFPSIKPLICYDALFSNSVIKKNSDLMRLIREISDATIEDGGEGAFYIYLKKKNK